MRGMVRCVCVDPFLSAGDLGQIQGGLGGGIQTTDVGDYHSRVDALGGGQLPQHGAAADPDALRQRFRCDPALRQEKKFSYFCHDRLVTKASALLSCIPAHR